MNNRIMLTDDAALLGELSAMKRSIQEQVLGPVVRAAGKLVADAASQFVPVQSGLLKASLGISRLHTYGAGARRTLYVAAGPRRGFRRMVTRDRRGRIKGFSKEPATAEMHWTRGVRNPVRYAHLVERGHGGPRPAPPHPFLEPAAAIVGPQIRALAEARLAQVIARTQQKISR